MKKVVYTIALGDYKLREPTYINKDWEHICFTDRNRRSNIWSMVYIDEFNNSRKKAREIKIRCDKYLDFDLLFYIDARFNIPCNLDKFVKKHLKYDLCLFSNHKRDCAYLEAKFCIEKGVGNKKDIINQIKFYEKDGFPKSFGKYATGILIRRNTPELLNFMKLWYDQVDKYSNRDQISFSYIMWKNPIKFNTMPFKETYRRFIQ